MKRYHVIAIAFLAGAVSAAAVLPAKATVSATLGMLDAVRPVAPSAPLETLIKTPADMQHYVSAASYSVQQHWYDVDSFKGKTCKLAVHVDASGTPKSAQMLGGDSATCDSLIDAVKESQFPALPAATVVEMEVAP